MFWPSALRDLHCRTYLFLVLQLIQPRVAENIRHPAGEIDKTGIRLPQGLKPGLFRT